MKATFATAVLKSMFKEADFIRLSIDGTKGTLASVLQCRGETEFHVEFDNSEHGDQGQGAIVLPSVTLRDISKSEKSITVEFNPEALTPVVEDKASYNTIDFIANAGSVKSMGNGFESVEGQDKSYLSGVSLVDLSTPTLVDREEFLSCLSKIVVAATKDETRYILISVRIILKCGQFRLVATDGMRLHSMYLPVMHTAEWEFTLAANAVTHLVKHVKGKTIGLSVGTQIIPGNPKINTEKTRVQWLMISDGVSSIQSRQLDGNYPNFEQVIPKESKYWIKLPTKFIRDTCKTMVGLKMESTKLEWGVNDGKPWLTILGMIPDKAKVYEQGTPIIEPGINVVESIAFNPKYLLDIANHFEGEYFTMHFQDDRSPGRFTADNDKYNSTIVLMPMRMS